MVKPAAVGLLSGISCSHDEMSSVVRPVEMYLSKRCWAIATFRKKQLKDLHDAVTCIVSGRRLTLGSLPVLME